MSRRRAPEHGSTPAEVIARLTADALTGSLLVLDDARLTIADGGTVRYSEVEELTA